MMATPSRLSTGSAHRLKTAPRTSYDHKFRQPDFGAAIATSAGDITTTPSSGIVPATDRAVQTPTHRKSFNRDPRPQRKHEAPRPASVGGRHVSFNADVDIHVVEQQTPSPSSNMSTSDMIPDIASAADDNVTTLPEQPSPAENITGPVLVVRTRTTPVVRTEPSSISAHIMPTAVADEPSGISVSTSSAIVDSSVVSTTTPSPTLSPSAGAVSPSIVSPAVTIAEPNGTEAPPSPADDASRRRQLLIAEAEKRVKALRERQQAEVCLPHCYVNNGTGPRYADSQKPGISKFCRASSISIISSNN